MICKLRLLGKTKEKIQESLKPLMTLPMSRGGCEFGISVIVSLTAAILFYEDKRRRGESLVPDTFDQETHDQWVERIMDDEEDEDSEDKLVKGPGKLKLMTFSHGKKVSSLNYVP